MKLRSEFNKFHEELKIDVEAEDLRKKRETLTKDIIDCLPVLLSSLGVTLNTSDIEVFDQGSYRHAVSTTIKSISGNDVDRDIAVAFPLDIHKFDNPIKIKLLIKKALDNNMRTIKIKRPCVTVDYASNIHIDFPIYAIYDGNYYLAKGKTDEESCWEKSNPRELNIIIESWFEGEQGNQFRRIVRYLKRWKQIQFRDTQKDDIPPSIGIMMLAKKTFSYNHTQDGDDDLAALKYAVDGMLPLFNTDWWSSPAITINLPVEPYTNVFYKMSEGGMDRFHKKLLRLQNVLNNAINVSEEYEASKMIREEFGNDFPLAPRPQVYTGLPRRNNSNA